MIVLQKCAEVEACPAAENGAFVACINICDSCARVLLKIEKGIVFAKQFTRDRLTQQRIVSMLDNGLIDVCIGLITLYLVLSVICSALKETISSWLGLRAKNLSTALENMLGQETAGNTEHVHEQRLTWCPARKESDE